MSIIKVKQLRFSSLLALSMSLMTTALIGCNNNTKTVAQMVATPMSKISPSSSYNRPQKIAQIEPPSYLDDRSTPVQVIKSYYNAIDTQEYVRAYSYWGKTGNSGKSQPPAYPKFAAGYSNTAQVNLTTGEISSEGAGGSVYSKVPVTLLVTNTNGSKDTFVGCYTTRQVNPKIFSAPPFVPIHIYSAQIRKIAQGENATQLMEQSCK